MILRDQPTKFSDDVMIRVSSAEDGTMSLKSLAEYPEEVWQNRKNFITSCAGDIGKTALVYMTYEDGRSYDVYRDAATVGRELSTDDDEVADGLVTQDTKTGLFLPIADCCATVLYDREHGALMLSHIGRHSIEVDGAKKSLQYMTDNYGTKPEDTVVWLSPAVSAANYPIFARQSQGLRELIVNDLRTAGVNDDNIEVSPSNTDTNDDYFSHSEYQKGRRPNGRFAVYARMIK